MRFPFRFIPYPQHATRIFIENTPRSPSWRWAGYFPIINRPGAGRNAPGQPGNSPTCRFHGGSRKLMVDFGPWDLWTYSPRKAIV
ncbi:MAG: hypothetical protein C4576_30225 [Desulfobacteraceae bacterium]|nr:MAG: hypothetical protein C4576_30225 [Desulfobacteraceae bacterium]